MTTDNLMHPTTMHLAEDQKDTSNANNNSLLPYHFHCPA